MLEIARQQCFEGQQLRFQHQSQTLNCSMRFSLFLPPQAFASTSAAATTPVLMWLSGLTCNDENFVQKAGAQRYAAQYGIALLIPDTSPRGENVPGDPESSWDFGHGAGFYVNATQRPWQQHYQMEAYITKELPALMQEHFPQLAHYYGISGHSMGGHGALTLGLKNPQLLHSISAFAPICSPMHCPWGKKALTRYLGESEQLWRNYDACHLISNGSIRTPLLIDQGSNDTYLDEQLKPQMLSRACDEVKHPLTLNMRAGYDHSYFFIASFIGEHIAYHAAQLAP